MSPNETSGTAGSSANWEPADRVLFSWFGSPKEVVDARLAELQHRDPDLAAAVRSRFGRLQRLGWNIGDATHSDGPQPGSMFGEFRIVRLLGSGGMGAIYLAEQTSLARRVALKVIRSDRLRDQASRDRFQRETRAVADLRDPGICAVLDAGEVDGTPYLAMQHIEGETLAERLAAERAGPEHRSPSTSGPSTAAAIGGVLQLIEKVARSLHTAHEAGVVHRDVKPGNVMIDAHGSPVLLDFGLASVAAAADATLTMTGDVLGTPAYMSPEQVQAKGKVIDRRSDVYSLAATLFECLTHERPFAGSTAAALFERILRDPTPEPRRHNPHVPVDVGAVIGKAMEKEPARRYATAAEFADELARLRRREPVRARRIGVVGRALRWAQRHPVGSALIVVLAASATITSVLLYSSLEQQKIITQAVADLTHRTDEFETLASQVIYDGVMADEKTLYPPWPEKIPAMEKWLYGDVADLLAKRSDIEHTLIDLRQGALPMPAGEKVDPRAHPRHAEWERLQKQVAALQRAQRIRSGQEKLAVPERMPGEQTWSALQNLTAGWPGVAPDRTTFGQEPLGLAFARSAVAAVDAGDRTVDKSRALDYLAWALAANGQDTEARVRSDEALAAAPPNEAAYWRQQRDDLEQVLTTADATLAKLQQRLDALTDDVHRTYRFERKSEQFLHDALVELQPKLADLEIREKRNVEQRLAWARRIDDLTKNHPRSKHTWAEAAAAIAKADDVVASRLYRAHPLDGLVPQVGLVPIGMNPVTRFWEFYDLRSAHNGTGDPAAIAIPEHREDGSIEVRIDMGIVFVLVPGGTFTMGAQNDDPAAPNNDEAARAEEGPPHPVTLAPFLLARHEMTQGQWLRLSGGEIPSLYRFGVVAEGSEVVTQANPVEGVDWSMCTSLLAQHGMILPTEAQWEYACRAGTSTPWFCEWELLKQHANVADAGWKRRGTEATESWSDGHLIHARVGSFTANAFGMFDMHGNIMEWCRDAWGMYSGPVQEGDGLRLAHDEQRMRRGGDYLATARWARASCRSWIPPTSRGNRMGLRAARVVARN